jgi:hypothetical protein
VREFWVARCGFRRTSLYERSHGAFSDLFGFSFHFFSINSFHFNCISNAPKCSTGAPRVA